METRNVNKPSGPSKFSGKDVIKSDEHGKICLVSYNKRTKETRLVPVVSMIEELLSSSEDKTKEDAKASLEARTLLKKHPLKG